jgi:hypothetical protein
MSFRLPAQREQPRRSWCTKFHRYVHHRHFLANIFHEVQDPFYEIVAFILDVANITDNGDKLLRGSKDLIERSCAGNKSRHILKKRDDGQRGAENAIAGIR